MKRVAVKLEPLLHEFREFDSMTLVASAKGASETAVRREKREEIAVCGRMLSVVAEDGCDARG